VSRLTGGTRRARLYDARTHARTHARAHARTRAVVSQLRRRRGDTRRYKFYFTIRRVRSETDRNDPASDPVRLRAIRVRFIAPCASPLPPLTPGDAFPDRPIVRCVSPHEQSAINRGDTTDARRYRSLVTPRGSIGALSALDWERHLGKRFQKRSRARSSLERKRMIDTLRNASSSEADEREFYNRLVPLPLPLSLSLSLARP